MKFPGIHDVDGSALYPVSYSDIDIYITSWLTGFARGPYHTQVILCIFKLRGELIAEMSLTIVTAGRRGNSASNRANFDTITSIEHAIWGHLWSRRLTDAASMLVGLETV